MGQLGALLAQFLPEPAPLRPYVHPSQYKAAENVRHYSDNMHKLYTPNYFTIAFSMVTLGLYIGVPNILIGLFFASWFSRAALLVLVLLFASLALPVKPRRAEWLLHSYLFLCWRRYFKFSYLFEQSLDCYQDYIIAQFPHGAFPFGALIGGTFMATQYPEYPCFALAARAAFFVPIWRHVHALLGTEVCTKTNFHRMLAMGVRGGHHHHRRSSAGGASHSGSGSGSSSHGHARASRGQAQPGAAADAPAGAAEQQQAGAQEVQQRSSSGGGSVGARATPFASASAAASVAAADGVTAVGAGARPTLGAFASAALAAGSGSGRFMHRRAASEPHGLSSRFSLPQSLFKCAHTLSDSESSDSESDSGSSCDTCTCSCSSSSGGGGSSGSGPLAQRLSADSSTGEPGAAFCASCGACLRAPGAEAPLAQRLASIPSGSLASVEDGGSSGSSSSGGTPLLGRGSKASQLVALQAAAAEAERQRSLGQPAQAAQEPAAVLRQRFVSQPSQQPQPQAPALLPAGSAAPGHHHGHHHGGALPLNRIDPATGRRKLGVSVGLLVGGIAEMFMIRRDHERIKLRDRKGFVRIALEHGVDILPVYMFGVNQALDFGPPWLQRISRSVRASVGVMYGIAGLPVPRRVPIFMVSGKPLPVGPAMRKDHPDFNARVDELHAAFCAEMERIYYAHRAKYGHGFENRPLVIC